MNLDQFQISGKFLMLAFDHRGSFKKMLDPENTGNVTEADIIQLKKEIIDSVKDQMSGVLVDQTYGLKAYTDRDKPFLLPVEASGYTEDLGERITNLQYSAEQLVSDGASGAKILLYFNPSVKSASQQIETVKKSLEDCQNNNLPYFLEIRVYKPDTGDELGDDTQSLVTNSLKILIENGIKPDVWKLEYPGSEQGCKEVTELVGVTPWILLTRGASFETFKEQLEQAIQNGAQGFLAGRALWQEVCTMIGEEKENFLKTTIPDRFRQIADIATR